MSRSNHSPSNQSSAQMEKATLGGGCFWCLEAVYEQLRGVEQVVSGYSGGAMPNPSYEQVSSGRSGHAEVVRVLWDVARIHFSDLLKLFWECHDPTQGDRQGNDCGSQYRSALYVGSDEHMALAETSRVAYQQLLSEAGYGPITTEIRQGVTFWPAETYHQQYLAKPGSRPYCSAQPSGVLLGDFPGSDYQLPASVWSHYDWSITHCVLRGDNSPIPR